MTNATITNSTKSNNRVLKYYFLGPKKIIPFRKKSMSKNSPRLFFLLILGVLYRILKLGGSEKCVGGLISNLGGSRGGLCIETPPGGLKVGGVWLKSWGGQTPPRGGLYKSLLILTLQSDLERRSCPPSRCGNNVPMRSQCFTDVGTLNSFWRRCGNSIPTYFNRCVGRIENTLRRRVWRAEWVKALFVNRLQSASITAIASGLEVRLPWFNHIWGVLTLKGLDVVDTC